MFDKIVQVFTESTPLQPVADQFTEMQRLVQEMIGTASGVYWGDVLSPEEREDLYKTDIQVNKLQRAIRKAILLHVSGSAGADVPYGLLVMSLVKDMERLGDYAKNLSEVHLITDLGAGDIPRGEIRERLRKIADFVEQFTPQAIEAYASSDKRRAQELAKEAQAVSAECDELLADIARTDFSTAVAVNTAVATRYYKRLNGHLLNFLTSVFMPLHKLDYMDEASALVDD